MNALLDQLSAIKRDRTRAHLAGLPALQRLVLVAQHDTGQSRAVGLFLLGLYNGHDYPFDLSSLRGLDAGLFSDCLAVLHLDYYPEREIHEYLEGGYAIFGGLQKALTSVGGGQ